MKRITLEVCVDDPTGIAAAVNGGADRIELCAALSAGGLTPSAGLMQIAAHCPLPVMAMIRPRAGNFVWSATELSAQLTEIAAVRDAGLSGVVIGASHPDGSLDEQMLRRLVQAAEGLDITLHRAIDLTPDVDTAIRLCRKIGIKRVLSSGGANNALAGTDRLSRMAGHGVTVMPGGGISAENIADLASHLNLTEVHASCSSPLPPPENEKVSTFGFQPKDARSTDANRVAALRSALDQLSARTSG